jgi:nitrile hydratase beta subunit
MNGVHDLGGMHGFGAVQVEPNEPVFHHPWEKKVFGIMVATMAQGMYNVDEFRFGIEQMNPADYLKSSYYEHWLESVQKNLIDKGVIKRSELEAKLRSLQRSGRVTVPRRRDPALAQRLIEIAHKGDNYMREPVPARFKSGDRVRPRNINPPTHTRLPRYVRGKTGVIDCLRGTFVTPDTNAIGKGEQPQPVYSVRFNAADLWGEPVERNELVYIDMWEAYLEPA